MKDPDIVEFLGIDVNINDIKNPHLRNVACGRNKSGFRFSYNNHSKYACHNEYNEDYDNYKVKYHEYTAYSRSSDHGYNKWS
jgi:hypothetical protein